MFNAVAYNTVPYNVPGNETLTANVLPLEAELRSDADEFTLYQEAIEDITLLAT